MRDVYGAETRTLQSTSPTLAGVMRSNTQGLTSALQYVPADVSIALSALFVLEHDRVVAVEVSGDV